MFINLVMRIYTHTGPLTQVTKELLLVTNNNDDPVMFKVKTTAPKQYCVRPNAGRIEPKSQVEVQGNCYIQALAYLHGSHSFQSIRLLTPCYSSIV